MTVDVNSTEVSRRASVGLDDDRVLMLAVALLAVLGVVALVAMGI
jgi:hypothetical protein